MRFRFQYLGGANAWADIQAMSDAVKYRVRTAVVAQGRRVRAAAQTKVAGVFKESKGGIEDAIRTKTIVKNDVIATIVYLAVTRTGWFGRIWETSGVHGRIDVKASVRAGHAIKAYTREVDLAPRPYLKPSFDAMRSDIRAKIIAAVNGPGGAA